MFLYRFKETDPSGRWRLLILLRKPGFEIFDTISAPPRVVAVNIISDWGWNSKDHGIESVAIFDGDQSVWSKTLNSRVSGKEFKIEKPIRITEGLVVVFNVAFNNDDTKGDHGEIEFQSIGVKTKNL